MTHTGGITDFVVLISTADVPPDDSFQQGRGGAAGLRPALRTILRRICESVVKMKKNEGNPKDAIRP
jgi:hypothetical protein